MVMKPYLHHLIEITVANSSLKVYNFIRKYFVTHHDENLVFSLLNKESHRRLLNIYVLSSSSPYTCTRALDEEVYASDSCRKKYKNLGTSRAKMTHK